MPDFAHTNMSEFQRLYQQWKSNAPAESGASKPAYHKLHSNWMDAAMKLLVNNDGDFLYHEEESIPVVSGEVPQADTESKEEPKKKLYDKTYKYKTKSKPPTDQAGNPVEPRQGMGLYMWIRAFERTQVDPASVATKQEALIYLFNNISKMIDWPWDYVDGTKKIRAEDGSKLPGLTSANVWRYSPTRSLMLVISVTDLETPPIEGPNETWKKIKAVNPA